jgi:hypothetical protein
MDKRRAALTGRLSGAAGRQTGVGGAAGAAADPVRQEQNDKIRVNSASIGVKRPGALLPGVLTVHSQAAPPEARLTLYVQHCKSSRVQGQT